MRITLAIPFQGHDADTDVDLDEATARQLLGSGWARPLANPTNPVDLTADADPTTTTTTQTPEA